MKAFAITNSGLEEYASQEVETLLGVKSKTKPSVVIFDATEEQIALLAYRAQSIVKVCSLLETFTFNQIDDLQKIKTDFTKIIPFGKTFRVKFSRQGSVDFSSQEIEPMLGDFVSLQFKEPPKVSMNNPDYIVYFYIVDETAYLGIDYCGFDLGKRNYRVFANPKSVHANISYIMLLVAGFRNKQTLIDPFCLSGEVGIEAALFASQKSPFFFDKDKFAFNKFMKFDFEKVDNGIKKSKSRIILSSPHMNDVRAAQKNAKIAGVEKELEFTRQDVEWLDLKMGDNSVDSMISNIPCPSFNMPEQALKRVYDDLFFQVKHILKKKGKVVVLGKNLAYFKRVASDVKLVDEISFLNGQDTLQIVVFEKN